MQMSKIRGYGLGIVPFDLPSSNKFVSQASPAAFQNNFGLAADAPSPAPSPSPSPSPTPTPAPAPTDFFPVPQPNVYVYPVAAPEIPAPAPVQPTWTTGSVIAVGLAALALGALVFRS